MSLWRAPFWLVVVCVAVLFVPAYTAFSLALDWADYWLRLQLAPLGHWLYTLKPPA